MSSISKDQFILLEPHLSIPPSQPYKQLSKPLTLHVDSHPALICKDSAPSHARISKAAHNTHPNPCSTRVP